MPEPLIRPKSSIRPLPKTSALGGKGPSFDRRTVESVIPYGRQWIDEEDIQAVVDVLRSDWLTTGPKVGEFEAAFAQYVGSKYAVAVSSGTAALHVAMQALNIRPGDEVIVPPMTFAATANCIVYQGGIPVFSDVDSGTLLVDPEQIEEKITPRTKAIIGVDYTGQPCDWDALRAIACKHSLALVADACHALGAEYKGKKVGALADMTTFSFHPVKHITTGEGGMVSTDDPQLARRLRAFRNHGITTDHRQRERQGSWFYEMVDLGFNYRLTDIQSALGLTQLRKLPEWLARCRAIAQTYDTDLAQLPGVQPLKVSKEVQSAYHLYVVMVDAEETGYSRGELFKDLRSQGIGVNVHYIPVHLHPYYRESFKTGPGLCPQAEAAYDRILSLPIFPKMTDEDVARVLRVFIRTIQKR
jgi:perosamine synthetase